MLNLADSRRLLVSTVTQRLPQIRFDQRCSSRFPLFCSLITGFTSYFLHFCKVGGGVVFVVLVLG